MTLDAYKDRPKLVFLKQEEWKTIWNRRFEPYEEEATEFLDVLRKSDNRPSRYEEDIDVEKFMTCISEGVADLGLEIKESIDRTTGKEIKLYSFVRRK